MEVLQNVEDHGFLCEVIVIEHLVAEVEVQVQHLGKGLIFSQVLVHQLVLELLRLEGDCDVFVVVGDHVLEVYQPLD